MAWRYGREDPFRLYHGLDGAYRRIADLRDEEVPEVRLPRPIRYRMFLYGCAMVAHEEEIRLAGGKTQQRTGRGG